ncbi:hypothetical protein F4776DRAFT_646923 [Hypoxylon sp. NC0597]|nr:hypothetical protein F4776DRAFT_646923 [Hypoxylon sp. NC0597]
MAAEATLSSTTVSTAFAGGTSYEAVDVYTRLSEQAPYVFSTEYWNAFTSPSSLTTSTTSTTGSPTTREISRSITSSPSLASSTNAAQSDSNHGLSGGAIAGIAIGCTVAGLVIGAIAGFFFLFRRQKPQGPKARSQVTSYNSLEKPLRSAFSSPFPTERLQLDHFLLDSSSDAEISSEMRSLSQLLQQHVENHYHMQPVSLGVDALSTALVRLGLDQNSTMSASRLASLAIDPNTRYKAIQHVIARVTFASVTLDGASPLSLLPEPISSFISLMPAAEGHRESAEAVDIALTRWRQLSAFLIHPIRSDRTPLAPSEDVSTHQAEQLAMSLNSFLEPFVAGDRQDRYEQENHLREVIVECVTFGYLLFSQPSEYRYRFEGGVRPNYIVVFPGLDRISDEEGYRYPSTAQPVVTPMVEMI